LANGEIVMNFKETLDGARKRESDFRKFIESDMPHNNKYELVAFNISKFLYNGKVYHTKSGLEA